MVNWLHSFLLILLAQQKVNARHTGSEKRAGTTLLHITCDVCYKDIQIWSKLMHLVLVTICTKTLLQMADIY